MAAPPRGGSGSKAAKFRDNMSLLENSDSSQFRRFNSRLGGENSRLGAPPELAPKGLICHAMIAAERRFSGKNRNLLGCDGKIREIVT
jgi:hypothetical protein